MSDTSLIQQSLFDNTELYIPLKTAKTFDFPLQHHIFPNGQFWGSIQDWLLGMVGSKRVAQQTWKDFRADTDHDQLCDSDTQLLPYIASDGKTYQTDHGTERVLYALAQYVRDNKKRPQVVAIKEYLVNAGAVLGWMMRNPDQAATGFQRLADQKQIPVRQSKAFRKHLDANYPPDKAEEAIEIRDQQKGLTKRIAAQWGKRGVNSGADYGELHNEVSKTATGATATYWREILGKSPRDRLSARKNAAINIVQGLAIALHIGNDSHGKNELKRDIHEAGDFVNWDKLRKTFPDMNLDALDPNPEQKKLTSPAAPGKDGAR